MMVPTEYRSISIGLRKTMSAPTVRSWPSLCDVVEGALMDGFDVSIDLNGVQSVQAEDLTCLFWCVSRARSLDRRIAVVNCRREVRRWIELLAVRPLEVLPDAEIWDVSSLDLEGILPAALAPGCLGPGSQGSLDLFWRRHAMSYIVTGSENSGAIELYYEDLGSGPAVVLIHGYPLSGRAWDKQVMMLLENGYRAITYDRRGFGKSSQPSFGYDYETLAKDLRTVLHGLDLHDVVLVGHSMGTGEVVRYLGHYGSERVGKAVLISPIPPFLLETDDNPEGMPASVFDRFVEAARQDTPAWMKGFLDNFYNVEKPGGASVSDQAYEASLTVAMSASATAAVDCIATWETDFRPELAKIDVPVLVIQGDDDNVLPFAKTGGRLRHSIPDVEIVVVAGGPHGISWTHAKEVNRALLNFLRKRSATTWGAMDSGI